MGPVRIKFDCHVYANGHGGSNHHSLGDGSYFSDDTSFSYGNSDGNGGDVEDYNGFGDSDRGDGGGNGYGDGCGDGGGNGYSNRWAS